jgi:hypothetical protein
MSKTEMMTRKAELRGWLDGIPVDDPRLDAVDSIRRGTEQTKPEDERLYGLHELPPFFGLKHYTSLARLQVQKVGISYGGRLRYRIDDVRRWLQSPECSLIREELRRKRRAQEGVVGQG